MKQPKLISDFGGSDDIGMSTLRLEINREGGFERGSG